MPSELWVISSETRCNWLIDDLNKKLIDFKAFKVEFVKFYSMPSEL